MSPRLRMLRTIRDARERLRDVAAAHVSAAAQVHARHERVVRGETAALTQATEEAGEQLLAARTVHDLEEVADELEDKASAVNRALVSAEEARTATVRATGLMQERERDLMRAERLMEREGKAQEKAHARLEQFEQDEITATRWKGPT